MEIILLLHSVCLEDVGSHLAGSGYQSEATELHDGKESIQFLEFEPYHCDILVPA